MIQGWSRAASAPFEWTTQEAPGYMIVKVGQGYEVYLGNRRVGGWVSTFEDAVGLVEADMRA